MLLLLSDHSGLMTAVDAVGVDVFTRSPIHLDWNNWGAVESKENLCKNVLKMIPTVEYVLCFTSDGNRFILLRRKTAEMYGSEGCCRSTSHVKSKMENCCCALRVDDVELIETFLPS